MTDNRKKFEATEGLLEDVMRKQAGSLEKAVLEAVMNSIDAGATSVEIDLSESYVTITDDGKGMDSEEIDEYFRKFGLKADDIEDKEFGKFRMGRGQIFNFGVNIWRTKDNILVVNLNEDETEIIADDETRTLDTEGLSYNVLDTEEFVDGCKIEIGLYKELENVTDKMRDIVKLVRYIPWLHDIDLTINGDEIYNEFSYNYETENAFIDLDDSNFGIRTDVYNKGAYVSDFEITCLSSKVVTKKDLDVNFARNDILETCDVWNELQDEIDSLTEQYLIDKDEYQSREKKWMLKRAVESQTFRSQIYNIELIEDVKESSWSLKQLEGCKITYANKGDKLAIQASKEAGVVALQKGYKGYLNDIVEGSEFLEYSQVIEDEMKFEMNEVSDGELSKKRKNRIDVVRWVLKELGYSGEVKAGWSKQKNVWKDDKGTLFVHKNYLKKTKDEFNTVVLIDCIRVAAHDGDSRSEFNEDWNFQENFSKYMKNFGEVQKAVLKGQTGVDLA